MTKLTVISPPEGEAVSLVSAKAFLRVGHGGEDGLMADLISQATARVEQASGLALRLRTLRVEWSTWPAALGGRGAVLPVGPVTALNSVTVFDGDGAASDHTGRFRLECGRLALRAWSMVPAVPMGGRVEVEFEAGFGGVDDVPPDLAQAVLLTLRETYFAGDAGRRVTRGGGPLPDPVEAILSARRGVRL